MGVRFLQTFMEKGVKNGVRHVDIQQEVEKFKRENDGRQPIIVVDLLSLHPLIFRNNQEIVLGGRYNVYNDRVVVLFKRLQAFGVKLVFFTDGPTREEKIPTNLTRRNENYTKAKMALGFIYAERDLSSCLQNVDMQAPSPMFSTFKKLASYFGDVFISVLNECDTELADYATRNHAIAVISNDSDFLIFKGKWKYWSARRLDAENLTTIEYNREALYATLGLSNDHMPLLATMCGNDYVQYELVKNFHKRVKEEGRSNFLKGFQSRFQHNSRFHFPGVASAIRKLGIDSSSISEEQVNSIAKLIFEKACQESGKSLIRSSLKCYDYAQMNRSYGSEFMRHLSQYDGRMNYVLLANIQYIVQLNHFDLSKTDLKPYFEIISPLLKRTMGIILSQEANALRTFYCKCEDNRDYEPIILQAECPPCNIPPLESLLFKKKGEDAELDKIRLELISWQISPNLIPDKIKILPPSNASNAVTLLYLVELEQISEEEADCLLLACNCPDDKKYLLKLDDMKRINERDARIAFLFTAVQVYINNCFYAVGWDEFCKRITFDGLYFHDLRQKWNTLDKVSMLESFEMLRLYAA